MAVNQLNFHHIHFHYNNKSHSFPITNSNSIFHTPNISPLTVSSTARGNSTNLLKFIPGGTWWRLTDSDDEEEDLGNGSKPTVTVLIALRRIWSLVTDDGSNSSRWVVCAAFGSLAVAALCEVSIPNLLTASIFSAQRGQTAVFYQNSQKLFSLCLISGLCSGMRSGCFGAANMILDISFFDKETVGNLTSRLGADCQRLSNIIGSDIHFIIRNVLTGTGALINLLTLSWPLALSSLTICLLLSTIFIFYGKYQKKAAKYTQEYSALANQVSHETFSLIRTVRSYGTEEEELHRYKQKLEKLASIGTRESAAYGLWNFSFNTLYRSTQIIAILFGGMSVLTGHVSAEQLTKYVLYCEWLIYAAWRIENYLSSLLQSVGASEKVFQLMALMPSDQFISEGKKLQELEGKIEFIDVSFHYPSRCLCLRT